MDEEPANLYFLLPSKTLMSLDMMNDMPPCHDSLPVLVRSHVCPIVFYSPQCMFQQLQNARSNYGPRVSCLIGAGAWRVRLWRVLQLGPILIPGESPPRTLDMQLA